MDFIKKILIDIVIGVWFVIAFFATVCLLSYNEFGTTVFGKNTILIMQSDELEPEFLEGDLLIVKRNSDSKINVGDKVFYYNTTMNQKAIVFIGLVESKEEFQKTDTTYVIDGEKVSSEYVIGTTTATKVHHKVGTILGVITSKWGFMFFILLPMLFAIVYEVMMIIDSSKANKKELLEEE
jgi:hypothetical protein